MSTLIDIVRSREEKRQLERRCFVEEQNIRRQLGQALWEQICAAIEHECENLNSAGPRRVTSERKPETLKVRDLETGRVFGLDYNDMTPCIVYRLYPGPIENIMFQVVNGPVPSLIPSLNGIPKPITELATDFMFSLISG